MTEECKALMEVNIRLADALSAQQEANRKLQTVHNAQKEWRVHYEKMLETQTFTYNTPQQQAVLSAAAKVEVVWDNALGYVLMDDEEMIQAIRDLQESL